MLFHDQTNQVDKRCNSEERQASVKKVDPKNSSLNADPNNESNYSLNNIENPDSNNEW